MRFSFESIRSTIPSRCCRSPFYTDICLDDGYWNHVRFASRLGRERPNGRPGSTGRLVRCFFHRGYATQRRQSKEIKSGRIPQKKKRAEWWWIRFTPAVQSPAFVYPDVASGRRRTGAQGPGRCQARVRADREPSRRICWRRDAGCATAR